MIDDRLRDELERHVGAMDCLAAPSMNQRAQPTALSPAEVVRIRQRYGPAAASLLIHSITLQHKAREKLGPGTWWVTPRGLEQATAWQVAQLKAEWFGPSTVADLCCGIGGDSLWLARRGALVGVDADPMIVQIARANLAQSNLEGTPPPEATLVAGEAVQSARAWGDVSIHIDPDRRPDQRRQTDPDRYSPRWDDVVSLVSRAPGALVKLAPAAELDLVLIDRPTHRCWISLQGSVREQSLLVGDLITGAGLPEQRHSAIAVRSDGRSYRFIGDGSRAAAPVASEPDAWLLDPDAAIRASGLTDAFALAYGLRTVGGPSGFLTSEAVPCEMAMATHERVEWRGPCDVRSLKKAMRSGDVFPQRIKVRGVDQNPAALAKRLKGCGSRPVTLWLGRVGSGAYAAWTTLQSQRAEP